MAGGLTGDAGSEILITRRADAEGVRKQVAVSLSKLFTRDNAEYNILLSPGDIVTVAEQEFFYIHGEVNRPDAYAFSPGMTIMRALGMAGGPSEFANRKEVGLLRGADDGLIHKTIVNLKSIEAGKIPDVLLLPDDIIIVSRRIF